MAVLAIFKYDIRPGRLGDFMTKLQAAAATRFDTPGRHPRVDHPASV